MFCALGSMFAQSSKFNVYIKDGKQNVNEVKEEDLGELWVSVPVPENVANYDLFIVSLCYGECGFNKTAEYTFNKEYITSKLNNKSQVDLLILNNGNPRSTYFAIQSCS
jgi:hypothetical protein